MKKNITLLLAVFLGSVSLASVHAQDADCSTNLSIFNEHAKVKNYDAAYEPWLVVYNNCPELHFATFYYGERILSHKIENATGDERTKFIGDLEKLYDGYIQYHPSRITKADVYIKKALLLYDTKTGTEDEIYGFLDKAFVEDRGNFKNEKAMYIYFLTLVDLNKAGKKDLQLVFDTYDNVNEKIEDEKAVLSDQINSLLPAEEAGTLDSKSKRTLDNARARVDNYLSISESIDATLGNLADCDNLIPLYEKNFAEKSSDAEWLKRAAGKMSDKDCTSDPLFVKLVESLHSLEPSASSAYYLGVLNEKNGKSAEAIKFFNQSVDLETDNFKKSRVLVKIATKMGKASAVNYANKALQFNASNSDAYRIIAHAYASSANECGTTSFEKRAIYWLAAQTARKGGLESLAARYDALAPSESDIFAEGMSGKTITFKCWVGKSVKVPSL